MNIWPNPALDYFTINGADDFTQIQLIDVNGKLVRQMKKLAGNRYTTHGLGKGMYFVRLQSSNSTVSIKLMIE